MMSRSRLTLAVSLPPLLIAVVALTHPAHLTTESAHHWQVMHTVLLPLFPLLGLGPWLVARAVTPPGAIVVGVLAYVYACFYTSLDVLAGIAGGAIKDASAGGLGIVFPVAGDLGDIGSFAYIGATALGTGAALRVSGWLRGAPAAVLTVIGSLIFWQEHVYRPWGVMSMVMLAAGWGWLALMVTDEAGGSRSPQSSGVPPNEPGYAD
jgi:hypothetical protein